MEELVDLHEKLKQRADDYVAWCGKVRKGLNINNDGLDIEYNSDEASETRKKTAAIMKKRPLLSQLQSLLAQATEHKYPRFDVALDVSSATTLDDSLLPRLERECLLAAECTKLVKQFLDLYKNGLKKEVKSEADGSNTDEDEDDVPLFVAKRRQLERAAAAAAAATTTHKHRPSLDQLKQLAKSLGELTCEVSERDLFLSLLEEALGFEARIERLVGTWCVEDTSRLGEVRALIDYLDRVDYIIEFPFMLAEQVRLAHRQAAWLHRVNEAVHSPAVLTLKFMRGLIEAFASESLLSFVGGASNGTSHRNMQIIKKCFGDLQELYSIAHTWDEKAREQLQST
jgi:hypothetical protein